MPKKFYDLEIEKSILSGCIKSVLGYKEVSSQINSDDFFDVQHKTIYEAIVNCYLKTNKIDDLLIYEHCRKNNKNNENITIDFIREINDFFISEVEINEYIKILKSDSSLRSLKQAIKSANETLEEKSDYAEIIANVEEKILSITRKNDKTELVKMSTVVDKVLEQLISSQNNNNTLSGINTGFKKLNEMTNGWQKGDFIILAARPSVGKTALSLHFLLHAARMNKKDEYCLYFSLEMSSEQIAQRLLSSESLVDMKLLKEPKFLNVSNKEKLYSAKENIDEFNIFVNDTPGINISELALKIRRAKIEHKISIVIIDYLQLLEHNIKNENRQQEISKISRILKSIARELNVPIIALSQLSRNVEKRENKKPIMSDIRESGAIEQDADLIMFLYRENEDNKETKMNQESEKIELIVAKHRNGPIGSIDINFFKKYGFFSDLN